MSAGAVCETGRRGRDRRDTLTVCQNETAIARDSKKTGRENFVDGDEFARSLRL
jgi:hypothetical protein